MNTVAIIQARMGSTRLPGKVMKRLGSRTVLGHVIHRAQAMASVTQVIVATTVQVEDDPICYEANRYNVPYYRGSVDHVLSRYYEASKQCKVDNIVRITSDCPLIDPALSSNVIAHFLDSHYDYSSTGLSHTFPRGLDTEVFTFEALERAYFHATKPYEFEHVTPYIYLNPGQFRVYAYPNDCNQSQYRITLDTIEDWRLLSIIANELDTGSMIYWKDVYQLFERKPELYDINSQVLQKKLGV